MVNDLLIDRTRAEERTFSDGLVSSTRERTTLEVSSVTS